LSFNNFGLDQRIIIALQHLDFNQPTPVQEQAIPVAISGKDILVSSQTGSGKTIAFLLPIMQRLLRMKAFSKRDPRALILAPTRELANQVYSDFRKLASGSRLKASLIVGGESFNDQAKVLRKEPDIIIATPGRFADHLKHRHIALHALEVLVLDEADRMLDLGFSTDLTMINAAADHRNRQTMLFSATIDDDQISNLAVEVLQNSQRIEIGHATDKHQSITQRLYLADHVEHKEQLLLEITKSPYEQVLVFTATKADSERLAILLSEHGHNAKPLHGDLAQNIRNKTMDDFKRTTLKVLVATDIAARGLDIKHVSHVVNFDLPKHPEDYIHRIGRTGRAGNRGIAISLVSRRDWQSLERIQLLLKIKFSFDTIDTMQARFKGLKAIKPKKTHKPSSQGPKKGATKQQRPAKRKPKVNDKSFQNAIEVGHLPMKKKKVSPDQPQD
jgi:superfamily II DNA/RNA helicase